MTKIRKAFESDLDAIADLAEKKRIQYERYQPVFHRRASNALSDHKAFLKTLLAKENTVLLVAEQEGQVLGFVYAALVTAPQVYDPQGKICFIDDFMVKDPSLWSSVGRDLAKAAFDQCKSQGAVLANIVCGPKDAPKRALLNELGFDVASEWQVRSL